MRTFSFIRRRLDWIAAFAVGLCVVWGAVHLADRATTSALQNDCIQNNILRAQDNSSHLADFNVFQFIYLRFLTPTKTETTQQKLITQQFAGRLENAINQKTWTALNNCTNPTNPEVEIYAIVEKKPPWYAMDLGNATKVNPIGSIP